MTRTGWRQARRVIERTVRQRATLLASFPPPALSLSRPVSLVSLDPALVLGLLLDAGCQQGFACQVEQDRLTGNVCVSRSYVIRASACCNAQHTYCLVHRRTFSPVASHCRSRSLPTDNSPGQSALLLSADRILTLLQAALKSFQRRRNNLPKTIVI